MITDIPSFKKHKEALYQRFCDVAAQRQAGVQLIMEHVDHPANLGAIARSCDALGVQQISYLPSRRHAREKRLIIQSSVSASQWLDFTEFTATKEFLAKLKADDWCIMATSPHYAATSIYDVNFTQYPKIAVMIGSESRGLSENAFENADLNITIPMAGFTQSFNVAVATAIVLSEVCRQRQQPHFLLEPQDQQTLVKQWINRLLQTKYLKNSS